MPKLENMDKIVKFVNIMIILLFLFIDSSYSMQFEAGKPFYILFKFPSLLLMQYLSHLNNIFFSFYITAPKPCKTDRDCPIAAVSNFGKSSKRMRCRKGFCVRKRIVISSKNYTIVRYKRINTQTCTLLKYSISYSSISYCDHPLNKFALCFSNSTNLTTTLLPLTTV
jgi:hypothetical protein